MPFKYLARPLSRLVGKTPREESASPADADDGGERARAAAIDSSDEEASLLALAGVHGGATPSSSSEAELAAQQRLAELIDAGEVDFEELCARAENPAALLAVAGHCADPGRLTRALACIEPAAERSRLVLEGPSSRVRQAAAQSISEPEELRRLLRELRGKDKSVYKIIREKCDALNAEAQRSDKVRSEAIAACESLERHSHRVYDAIYEPTLRHFLGRWQAVAAQAEAPIEERAARALRRCEEIVAEHHERLKRQTAEATERAEREADRERTKLEAQLEAARLKDAAVREAEEKAAREQEETRARAEHEAAQAQALREINALIGRTRGALREGGTGRASGLRRALEEKLRALPQVPPPVARQVQQLDATLSELKDWKEHAAAPKRAELVAEMETLVGSTLEPRALAERIRQLQEDWKTVSKGVAGDSGEDWQRFHQAAQSAYQPCREHFEAEARGRQANAAARKSILERLRAFEAAHGGGAASPGSEEAAHGGAQIDFGAVATVLREAPQEWRRHFPVERAEGRTLQREFDAVIERLAGRLAAWHEDNAERKRSLIAQAGQLVGLDDGREATESVKRLQARWSQIGAAAREQERGLWEEFRGHCDAVFQKRLKVRAEQAAGLQANRERAQALCEQIEALAELSGAALLEAASTLSERRSAFEAVGELPRDAERSLRSRFERGVERVRGAVSRQRSSEKEQAIHDLLEAARRIHAYGWALQGAASETEREALKHDAQSFIAAVSRWPAGGAEAIEAAWAGAAAPVRTPPGEQTDPETRLRTLCIRGELHAERPIPPEDQELRRNHQLRLLMERMGQGRAAAEEDFEALALEWVRVPAADLSAARYCSLLERFRGSSGRPSQPDRREGA